MKRNCSIYCFTNLINGKRYIGSTIVEPNRRYNQHMYNATHENTHQYNYPLYEAIRKYGKENFDFKVLYQEECEEEHIRELEREYILRFNTLSPNGYNQIDNTEHPINAMESYKKMSETKRNNAKKVAQIDDNNNIIKIFRSIIDCAEELKIGEKHIASCCRGERHTTEGMRFVWIDDNDNLIIPKYVGRNCYKGATGTTQIQSSSRQVAKIDLETNEILEIYPTVALAGRENNCDSSAICKVCTGKRKKCGGYGWKYIERKENTDE